MKCGFNMAFFLVNYIYTHPGFSLKICVPSADFLDLQKWNFGYSLAWVLFQNSKCVELMIEWWNCETQFGWMNEQINRYSHWGENKISIFKLTNNIWQKYFSFKFNELITVSMRKNYQSCEKLHLKKLIFFINY